VLDVGTGSGLLANRLREVGASEVVGVDLMAERIQQARQRYLALTFEQASATALPFDDDAFDVVAQFTCLSSILDEATRRRVAAEMWRVLRPGGTIISYDLRSSPRPIRALGRLARRRADSAGWTPVTGIDVDELREFFPGEPVRHPQRIAERRAPNHAASVTGARDRAPGAALALRRRASWHRRRPHQAAPHRRR
jgi:SAM-dependent methyltransferase